MEHSPSVSLHHEIYNCQSKCMLENDNSSSYYNLVMLASSQAYKVMAGAKGAEGAPRDLSEDGNVSLCSDPHAVLDALQLSMLKRDDTTGGGGRGGGGGDGGGGGAVVVAVVVEVGGETGVISNTCISTLDDSPEPQLAAASLDIYIFFFS